MKRGQVAIFVIIAILIVDAIILTVFVSNSREPGAEEVSGKTDYDKTLSDRERCEMQGGTWREFPNTCADSCELERSPEIVICGQVLTYGCDCGEDSCWDFRKKRCEIN